MKEATHILGLFAIGLTILVGPILFTSCKKPPRTAVEEVYAFPPEGMLRFFDFPKDSWWHYKCLQDGTIDTLSVYETYTTDLRKDRHGGGSYKIRSISYQYLNTNAQVHLGQFVKEGWPLGVIKENEEDKHKFFKLYEGSLNNHFNLQQPFMYPIDEVNTDSGDSALIYQKIDTVIQQTQYPEIYRFPAAWSASTLDNPIVEEWYVRDLGVVRYTLANGLEYELIEYQIKQ